MPGVGGRAFLRRLGASGFRRHVILLSGEGSRILQSAWTLLREIGCDVAQGRFVGRPMPGDGLRAWLADWQSKRPRLTAP
jgi:predicted signal transduction protein with EAL and GGDEF domain